MHLVCNGIYYHSGSTGEMSQNPHIPFFRMLLLEHKCAHFCFEWSIRRYGTGAFSNLWNWSVDTTVCYRSACHTYPNVFQGNGVSVEWDILPCHPFMDNYSGALKIRHPYTIFKWSGTICQGWNETEVIVSDRCIYISVDFNRLPLP